MPKLFSLQDVARRLGKPYHVVRYAVAAVDLQPAQRVGIVRLWTEEQIAEIVDAMGRVGKAKELIHA